VLVIVNRQSTTDDDIDKDIRVCSGVVDIVKVLRVELYSKV